MVITKHILEKFINEELLLKSIIDKRIIDNFTYYVNDFTNYNKDVLNQQIILSIDNIKTLRKFCSYNNYRNRKLQFLNSLIAHVLCFKDIKLCEKYATCAKLHLKSVIEGKDCYRFFGKSFSSDAKNYAERHSGECEMRRLEAYINDTANARQNNDKNSCIINVTKVMDSIIYRVRSYVESLYSREYESYNSAKYEEFVQESIENSYFEIFKCGFKLLNGESVQASDVKVETRTHVKRNNCSSCGETDICYGYEKNVNRDGNCTRGRTEDGRKIDRREKKQERHCTSDFPSSDGLRGFLYHINQG